MSARSEGISLGVALAACVVCGCAPSAFDELSGGKRQQGDPSQIEEEDSGEDEESSLDAESPAELEPDAAPAPPRDAGMDASREEAGATDAADVPGPKDAGSPRDAGPSACSNSMSVRPLRAGATATELARLKRPDTITTRTLGPTVQLATNRIWAFSTLGLKTPEARPLDRPANFPSSARDGTSTPWTLSTPTSDWSLSENLDARGVPSSLLTLTASEQAAGQQVGDLTSVYVASLLRDPAQPNSAIGFAKKVIGIFVPFTESWLVTLSSGSNVAVRGSAPLFQAPDPLYGHAAVRDGDYFKLFACTPAAAGTPLESAYPCTVARVPVARVGERAAYEFYTRDTFGAGVWAAEAARSAAVVNATAYAVSLSFNEYLQQFLMVYGQPGSSDVALRSAPAPEGPWSEPVLVKQSKGLYWDNLDTREQESLAQNCGKRIIVSTWAPQDGMPLPDGGGVLPSVGDVVLSAIDLQ